MKAHTLLLLLLMTMKKMFHAAIIDGFSRKDL
jgi:hypothetical protein